MINCSSSSNRDVDTDDEFMQNTNATALNEANAEGDRTGAYEATSAGSPFMSGEKSETITTPQGVKDGDK